MREFPNRGFATAMLGSPICSCHLARGLPSEFRHWEMDLTVLQSGEAYGLVGVESLRDEILYPLSPIESGVKSGVLDIMIRFAFGHSRDWRIAVRCSPTDKTLGQLATEIRFTSGNDCNPFALKILASDCDNRVAQVSSSLSWVQNDNRRTRRSRLVIAQFSGSRKTWPMCP
jgi:hypothetical protein